MKSTEFLQAAIDVQAERGKQYDKPSGERSMAATVSAFNCITGSMLEESDGWMFLGLLKLVRQSQNPEQYHHDSALDFVAYASLYAEAASEQCGQLEAQEAEKASHIISDIPTLETPDWKKAPDWALFTAQDECGDWCWFDVEPSVHTECQEWILGDGWAECETALESEIPNHHWMHTLLSRPTSTAK